MNAKATAVVEQLTEGTEVRSLRPVNKGQVYMVARMTEKSVYFTSGQYENKRSMHWYEVA